MIRSLGLPAATLLACLTAPGVANGQTSKCDVLEQGDYDHARYPWQQVTPLEYLTYIRFLPESAVTVHGCKEDWVTEADVSKLMELLDSKEPCPNQMSARSSFWDVEKSTVGNEAAWLIESFRVGRFPPGLNSTRSAPSATELRRWWKERQLRSLARPTDTAPESVREK